MGNILAAALLEDHHVLDPNAELTGQVDAGLGGADDACGQRLNVAGVGAGVLVDLQTKAVAVAVAEVFAVTGVGNDLPGGAVNILAGNAGLRGGDGGQLRLENGVVHVLHLVGGVADPVFSFALLHFRIA